MQEDLLQCWNNALYARRPRSYYEDNWERSDVQDEAIGAGVELGDLLYFLPLEKMLKVKNQFTSEDYYTAWKRGSKNAEEIGLRTIPDENVMHTACHAGHERVVRAMLDARVFEQDHSLYLAADCEHTEIVRMLVNADVYDESALWMAVIRGHAEVVRVLIDAGYRDDECVIDACCHGRSGILQLLIDAGMRHPRGMYEAIRAGRLDCIRILVASEGRIQRVYPDCLLQAVQVKDVEVVTLLLDAGMTDNRALRLAIKKRLKDIVRLMRRYW